MSPVELYKDKTHEVLMFTDLIEEDGQAVQANQFLICDGDTGAIIDPGGNLAFNELFLNMSKHFPPSKLAYLIASHADPDIIASLDRWMTSTRATLVISRIWERFAPHFAKVGKTAHRVVGVPDAGGRLPLGQHELWLLPAHFMHSEGNFHFYDPVSRILFTGDLGASLVSGQQAREPVTELKPHLAHMEGFHRRYMVSNKVLRLGCAWHGNWTSRCSCRSMARRSAAPEPSRISSIGSKPCNAALICSIAPPTACPKT